MTDPQQAFLQVLDEMELALSQQVRRNFLIQTRIDVIRRALADGGNLVDVVRASDGPTLPSLITDEMDSLSTYGAAVRRAQARALHASGMTMEEIASLFGVTRQRISALVAEAPLTRRRLASSMGRAGRAPDLSRSPAQDGNAA